MSAKERVNVAALAYWVRNDAAPMLYERDGRAARILALGRERDAAEARVVELERERDAAVVSARDWRAANERAESALSAARAELEAARPTAEEVEAAQKVERRSHTNDYTWESILAARAVLRLAALTPAPAASAEPSDAEREFACSWCGVPGGETHHHWCKRPSASSPPAPSVEPPAPKLPDPFAGVIGRCSICGGSATIDHRCPGVEREPVDLSAFVPPPPLSESGDEGEAVFAKARAALDEAIANGNRLRMSIPANPERDHDLLISDAIERGNVLARRLREAEEHEALAHRTRDSISGLLDSERTAHAETRANLQRVRDELDHANSSNAVLAKEATNARQEAERLRQDAALWRKQAAWKEDRIVEELRVRESLKATHAAEVERLRAAAHEAAQEGHTLGRIYAATGERAHPNDEVERVRAMTERLLDRAAAAGAGSGEVGDAG